MGPTEVQALEGSGRLMNMFMLGQFPGGRVPLIKLGFVDVREVATAHVNCIERDEA